MISPLSALLPVLLSRSASFMERLRHTGLFISPWLDTLLVATPTNLLHLCRKTRDKHVRISRFNL